MLDPQARAMPDLTRVTETGSGDPVFDGPARGAASPDPWWKRAWSL